MKKQFRKYPEFVFPVPNGAEQYKSYAALMQVTARMKEFGVKVDLGEARRLNKAALKRAKQFTEVFCSSTKLEAKVLGEGGTGTTKLVREWFEKQGAPDVSFDKKSGRPQFNAVALTSWAEDFKGEAFSEPAAALLGIRKAKTSARFSEAYLRVAAHHGGRIHFGFNPMGTKGLRWSASEKFAWFENDELVKFSLNAQNVPSKEVKYTFKAFGELVIAESLRSCFIAAKGTVWQKYDYVGAEALLIALNTGDRLLLNWLKLGAAADMHTENAKLLFTEETWPEGLVKADKEHGATDRQAKCRDGAKNLVYALSYQMPSRRGEDKYPESFKFMKQRFPKMTEAYFNVIVARFYAAHPAIRDWQLRVCAEVDAKGYVKLSQNEALLYVSQSAKGRNMAGNFFMQSGVGFLVNRAVPKIGAMCDWKRTGLALLLQVHDEVDLQVPDARREEVKAVTKGFLEEPANFGDTEGHIPVEVKESEKWG